MDGKVFYGVKLTCDDFNVWFNKDKEVCSCRKKDPCPKYKVKLKGGLEFISVSGMTRDSSFFSFHYTKTHRFSGKSKWKLDPISNSVFQVLDTETQDTINIEFSELIPAKTKLFSRRLARTYLDKKCAGSSWPHWKTTKSSYLYRKYKYRL